jgi:hypothetical protein
MSWSDCLRNDFVANKQCSFNATSRRVHFSEPLAPTLLGTTRQQIEWAPPPSSFGLASGII